MKTIFFSGIFICLEIFPTPTYSWRSLLYYERTSHLLTKLNLKSRFFRTCLLFLLSVILLRSPTHVHKACKNAFTFSFFHYYPFSNLLCFIKVISFGFKVHRDRSGNIASYPSYFFDSCTVLCFVGFLSVIMFHSLAHFLKACKGIIFLYYLLHRCTSTLLLCFLWVILFYS